MKVAIIALVLAVSLIQSADAWWGWGGLYGGWGMGMGMWGYPYMWGKRDAAPKYLQESEIKHTRYEPHHEYLQEERKLALVEEKIADIKREFETEKLKSTIKRELLNQELIKVREILTEMKPREYLATSKTNF